MAKSTCDGERASNGVCSVSDGTRSMFRVPWPCQGEACASLENGALCIVPPDELEECERMQGKR